VCLRFDHRGMGDSEGEARSFDALDDDIRAAVDALLAFDPRIGDVVLWGLCDAASAATIYVRGDARISGLVLLNPWVRSEATLARTHLKHYYLSRALQGDFWRRMLRGEYQWRESLASLARQVSLGVRNTERGTAQTPREPFQRRMLRGLASFKGPALLVLSGNDLTAREFEELSGSEADWIETLKRPQVTIKRMDAADHTFSRAEWRAAVESATLDWLHSF
jgi:uncharacterized protein